jgi:hypothetical protein
MQNNPSFMPRESSFLEIEVKPNDVDGTFETNLHCSRNHCGETVHIDSNGPKTIQSVSCPKHGFLASFPHQIALSEFVRFLSNKILAANGHKLIEEGALFILGNDAPLSKFLN